MFWIRAVVAVALTCVLAPAAQALEPGISATPSSTQPYYACPAGGCQAVIDPLPTMTPAGWELPAGGPLLEGSGEQGGYGARDIESAYGIPPTGGDGQTVAIVDAFDARWAERGLAVYRERYGLGPCTKANGCFRKVNQAGEERNYPESGRIDWIYEIFLDLDMVSAACPHCKILLVEARGEQLANLGAAENTAVRLGATEVSNSYGYAESESQCGSTGCTQYSADYEHPGIPIVAGGGDGGYNGKQGGDLFPAVIPGVIAVGGTNLHKASNARGWREEAWEQTGSGCSAFEPKPDWQTDSGCGERRTTNDVAAVAGPTTPVSVWIQGSETAGGWVPEGGTSAATPIVAGIEAHANEYTRDLGPLAFYIEPQELNDVTTGSNGKCAPAYLCTAAVGYDGPTGMGTPAGIPFVAPNEGGA